MLFFISLLKNSFVYFYYQIMFDKLSIPTFINKLNTLLFYGFYGDVGKEYVRFRQSHQHGGWAK